MKKLYVGLAQILLLFTVTSAALGQTYGVEKVTFQQNNEAFEYFQKVDSQHLVLYSDMFRSSLENEEKIMRYEFQKEGESLLLNLQQGENSHQLDMEKVNNETYRKDIGEHSYVVDLSGTKPVVYHDVYVSPEKKEGHEEDYNNLMKGNEEKVRALRLESSLKPVNNVQDLHVERTFEVTDISVEPYDDVLAFAENYESLGPVNSYHKMKRSTLDNIYVGVKHTLTIDGSYAKLHSGDENGSNQTSAGIDRLNSNKYRMRVVKLYFDFIIEEGGEESFEIAQIKHGEFFKAAEEYEDSPEFKKLVEKYGEEIPYYSITQEVKMLD